MYRLICFARDEGLAPPRLIAKASAPTLKEALLHVERCFKELAGDAREISATLTLWSPSDDSAVEPAE